MKKISIFVIALFSVFSMNAQFAATSIVADGGFEVSDGFPTLFSKTGNAGFKATTPGANDYTGNFWDTFYTTTTSTQIASISTTQFRTGTQSLKLTLPIAVQTLSPKLRTKALVLGQTINDWANFKITIYAKVLKLDGTAFTGTKKIFVNQTLEANDQWQKFVFNSATTTYSTSITGDKILISFNDLKEDYAVYLDDITVEKINTAAPTANAATNITTTSFDANWNTLVGATSYRLTVQTSINNWATQTTSKTYTIDGNSATTYSLTGIDTNTAAYRYKVEGFDGTNYSASSAYVTVNTYTALNELTIPGLYTKDGKIYFQTEAGKKISLLNSVGQLVFSGITNDGLNEISAKSKGVFILKINNQSTKIIL